MTMSDEDLTPGEWDHWRDSPLTKKCVAFLCAQAEKQWGRRADNMMRERYADIFADPKRQADYSALRGGLDAFKELSAALEKTLDDVIDPESDAENQS